MPIRALALGLLLASPALAAEPQVYRLSPAAIEAAKAEASLRPESAALLPGRDTTLFPSLYDAPSRDNRIHGEAGFFIGTGGARGAFGTALIPLGQNGTAQLSFETSRLPRQNFRR